MLALAHFYPHPFPTTLAKADIQSAPMKLTTGKKQTKTTNNSESSSAELFNKAWARVAHQQKKNDRLREQIKTFAEQVSEAVEQQEKAYVTTLYQDRKSVV